MKAANIASIMAQPDVDGALVGGASLDAEEFASIVRYPRARGPLARLAVPGRLARPGIAIVGPLAVPFERNDPTMPIAFAYTLIVLLIITSILLTLLILLHRGKGGGMSSMFGGGVTSSLAGSSVAEKNLDRYTDSGRHRLVRLHRRPRPVAEARAGRLTHAFLTRAVIVVESAARPVTPGARLCFAPFTALLSAAYD